MSDTDRDSLQPGWITRARSLREIVPVVALADALSPATSILALLLSVATLAVTSGLAVYFNAPLLDGLAGGALLPVPWLESGEPPASVARAAATAGFIQHPLVAFTASLEPASAWKVLVCQLALLLLWFVPLGIVLRQTALAIAGRNRMSFMGAARFVLGRWQAMLIGPLIPLVGVALLWLLCWAIAAACDFLLPTEIGSIAAAIVSVPLFALAGLLLGGLILALPLIWAAAVVEHQVDGFDVVSRGFEYLFQRPLRFVFYILATAAIWLVVMWLAGFLFRAGVAVYADAAWNQPRMFPARGWSIADLLLRAFGLNLFWALAAGVYLLVRRDQNHRDIEDVWEPLVAVHPLPELPETAE